MNICNKSYVEQILKLELEMHTLGYTLKKTSLKKYLKEFFPSYSIKISKTNIKSLPLYAILQ